MSVESERSDRDRMTTRKYHVVPLESAVLSLHLHGTRVLGSSLALAV